MPEAASAPPPGTQSREDLLRQMSFLEHLEELRKRLIYSLVSVAVSFFICYNYREQLYGFMQRPIIEALRSHQMSESLVYLSPTEPFNLYIKIAFLAGVFVACPVILYQLWLSICPGLYRHEKRYVVPFMIPGVASLLAAGGWKLTRIVPTVARDSIVEAVPA